MRWGPAIIPAPKRLTNLPDASKSRIGSIVDILPVTGSNTQEFAPHRSRAQMLLPSLSTATAATEPALPSGICAQFSMVRYGLGRLLTGVTSSVVTGTTPPVVLNETQPPRG